MLAGVILLAGCAASNTSRAQETVPSTKPTVVALPNSPTQVTFTPLVPSVPTGLYVPAAGIGTSDGKPLPVKEYTDAQVAAAGGGVDPPNLREIDWWSGGGRPGANPTNTTVTDPSKMNYTTIIYGHTWVDKDPGVFNNVRTLQPGAVITLTTTSGTFYYKVQQVVVVPKGNFAGDPVIQIDQPGRLILASCYRPPGYSPLKATDHNVAAIAQQFWPNASNGGG